MELSLYRIVDTHTGQGFQPLTSGMGAPERMGELRENLVVPKENRGVSIAADLGLLPENLAIKIVA
jgi:hypothetical protein